jgi:hypothetical protein
MDRLGHEHDAAGAGHALRHGHAFVDRRRAVVEAAVDRFETAEFGHGAW